MSYQFQGASYQTERDVVTAMVDVWLADSNGDEDLEEIMGEATREDTRGEGVWFWTFKVDGDDLMVKDVIDQDELRSEIKGNLSTRRLED